MQYEFISDTEITIYIDANDMGTILTGENLVSSYVDTNGDNVSLETPFIAKVNIVLPRSTYDIRKLYSLIRKGYSLILTRLMEENNVIH